MTTNAALLVQVSTLRREVVECRVVVRALQRLIARYTEYDLPEGFDDKSKWF